MAQARSFSLGGSSRGGLLLAAILAAVTGVLVFVLLQGNDDSNKVTDQGRGGDTTVVTARQNIAARDVITSDMLELTKVPSGALLTGALADRNLVEGQVARYPIYKGEQVIQNKLASEKEDLDNIPFVVPEGMRGIAVEVNKVIGAGGLLRPGDFVDVVGVIEIKYKDLTTDRDYTDTRSFTLAQNVQVLAVEDKLVNTVRADTTASAGSDSNSSSEGTSTDQAKPDPDAKVVTLALTPQDAQNLLLADEKGTIRLAARAAGDNKILDLGNGTLLSLVDPAFAQLLQDTLKQPKR